MATKTVHFIQAVALDRPVLVEPEQARQVMEVYIAADLSAETNEPVTLPLANKRSARSRLELAPGETRRRPEQVEQPQERNLESTPFRPAHVGKRKHK
jgi:hypothetical protein